MEQLIRSSSQQDQQHAIWHYNAIISRVGENTPTGEEAEVLIRNISHVLLIMPDSVQSRVVERHHPRFSKRWQFTNEADQVILRWFRSQDPLPRTAVNERLQEHIRRVVQARHVYADEMRLSGVDDRGEAFIRYGAPNRMLEIDYTDFDFQSEVFRFGIAVTPRNFPNHELWFYDDIDSRLYYLFIEEGTGYRSGTTRDLLPERLKRGFQGGRGKNHAYSAMYAMEHIYEQLALVHTDFGGRYAEVANYIARQEELAMMEEMGGTITGNMTRSQVGDGISKRTTFEDPTLGLENIGVAARRILSQGWAEDEQATRRRAQVAPESRTKILDNIGDLEVPYRVVRELNEVGNTQTNVYWEISGSSLRITNTLRETLLAVGISSQVNHLIRASATLFDWAYERRDYVMNHEMYVTNEQDRVQGHIQALGAGDLYHIGLQWSQLVVPLDEQLGPVVRLGTSRVDSVASLHTAGQLEMSDLKPLYYKDKTVGKSPEQVIVQTEISPQTQLALYFEVYNLVLDADDQTRYTVEYEVEHTAVRNGFLSRLRGGRTRETATQATYKGRTTRAEEYIVIDPSEVAPEGRGEITITVRITDEQANNTIERQIRFTLQEST